MLISPTKNPTINKQLLSTADLEGESLEGEKYIGKTLGKRLRLGLCCGVWLDTGMAEPIILRV